MKPRLVILDADAVIHLHELDRWEKVVDFYQLLLPETVALKECRYFENESGYEVKISIGDLISSCRIQVKSASVSEIAQIQKKLGKQFNSFHEIHFGELEAMAVLLREEKHSTRICTGDTAAVVALCCLDYGENVISVETLLSGCGFSAKVGGNFSEEALQNKLKRGREFHLIHGTQF